ncbi:hypothetical protein DFH28DRAFT_1129296 [Melampsora americana]|nr:hypothetical protein DFH28DRAFT_1129296 [Melampsora americana]
MVNDKCFVPAPNGLDESLFFCLACNNRPMLYSTIRKHRLLPSHIRNHSRWLESERLRQLIPPTPVIPDVEQPSSSPASDPPVQNDVAQLSNNVHYDDEMRQNTIVDMWTRDYSSLFRSPILSVNGSEDDDIQASPMISGQGSDDRSRLSPLSQQSKDSTGLTEDESWAPFTSLEACQFVGLSILGTTRTTLSLLEYERIRYFVGLLKVRLPGYKSLKNARKNLKKRYAFDVVESELGNPYVRDHLEFIPELPHKTSEINRFSQSKQWREELPRDLRVQMVDTANGHFYLYEVVQLYSKRIVVPIFFFKSGTEIMAKCVFAKLIHCGGSSDMGPGIKIDYQSVSDFNSESLSTINVNTFWKIFDDIELRPGEPIKGLCDKVMHGMSMLRLSIPAEIINAPDVDSAECEEGISTEIPIYNPWRAKAGGRIIRHVPLVMYCDNLSGNVSKRWNKHIAFYCTLAGLPPKFSNQEYNCHFVTTSNTAGLWSLQTHNLVSEGFVAFDHSIDAEVFVMTVVLCHLGDSPMHAEVTNTMMPTNSLTPCRICNLRVNSMADKRSTQYICDFVGVDENGNKSSLPKRDWSETIRGTKELWSLAQQPGNIGLFESHSATLGEIQEICRGLNHDFGDRLFNPFLRLKGFDGHKHTPVEILHVVLLGVGKYLLRHQMQRSSATEKDKIRGRWRSFETAGLNIPKIQPKTMIAHFQSLNGKEFRTVLQAAPFVFFDCDLTKEERETWKALSNLAPYIFQTKITDMDIYLTQTNQSIQAFLKAIVQMSAQWCNKPKFHMLTHLCDAIDRYGPAMLFGTENFECYNGNTRQSSIKSNHLSPGRDIATSFNNHRLMRSVTAGTKLYDKRLQTYIRASVNVRRIFETSPLLQKALGYNTFWNKEKPIQIGGKLKVQPSAAHAHVPEQIANLFTAQDWTVLQDITLANQQKVGADVFVSVAACVSTGRTIGRVKNVWGVGACGLEQTKLEVAKCRVGMISAFYGMRELAERDKVIWINPQDIEGVINVQHDCNKSRCTVQQTRQIMIERRVTVTKDFAVVHAKTSNFIINSAAFYSAGLHQGWACLPSSDITPAEWKDTVRQGLAKWAESIKEKDDSREKKREREKAKLLDPSRFTQARKKRKQPEANRSPSETPAPPSPCDSAATDYPCPLESFPIAGPSNHL